MKYQVLNCVVCQKTINLMKHGSLRWYKEGKLTGFTHLGKCAESKKAKMEKVHA